MTHISSVGIESVLYQHEAILIAAVVVRSDAKWGKTPCDFIVLRSTSSPNKKM